METPNDSNVRLVGEDTNKKSLMWGALIALAILGLIAWMSMRNQDAVEVVDTDVTVSTSTATNTAPSVPATTTPTSSTSTATSGEMMR